jgi:hypothetical protein
MTRPTKNPRFDELSRPDRYDERLESERHSEAASLAACGVESVYPQGYHKPTGAEIRQAIEAHERDMAIGAAWSQSLDHRRHDPESFRRYLLSPKYRDDHKNFVEAYDDVHQVSIPLHRLGRAV